MAANRRPPLPGERVAVDVVADIGGTNARFACVDSEGGLFGHENRHVADYPTFDAALTAYLADQGAVLRAACLAVAGPVRDGVVDFTNSEWALSISHLEEVFAGTDGPARFVLMNDFEALAYYAVAVGEGEQVKEGEAILDAPRLVIGPGTGLGQSIGVPQGSGAVLAIATEGGHVHLPARTSGEAEIVARLSELVGRTASAEDALSGPGLARLDSIVRERRGDPHDHRQASDITAAAAQGEPAAIATLDVFFCFLGSVVRNAALSTGARGGVFLAGGILPRFKSEFRQSPFNQIFCGEGPMQAYLEQIPVSLILADDAALKGAAARLRHQEATD